MTEDKMTDTTTTDQPPTPNGHGPTNGVTNGESAKDATPSAKKTKAERRAEKKAAAATTAAAATVTPNTPESVPATATPAAEPSEAPAAPPAETPAQAATAPIETPVDPLRLRMKVWSDPTTAKRYLMPSAFMRDVVNGHPVSDVMYAYAMRDDSAKIVTLTAAEWNTLPFAYFQEDGPAPRAASRPLDDVPVSYAKTP